MRNVLKNKMIPNSRSFQRILIVVLFLSLQQLETAQSFIAGTNPTKASLLPKIYGGGVNKSFLRSLSSDATLEKVKEESTVDGGLVVVDRPAIHWTVPGYKMGWQDEEGNWFDEDGPRNGPPMNYWRQSSDERAYNKDMDCVSTILKSDAEDIFSSVESTIEDLEKKNCINKPTLSRKVMGKWAALVRSGDVVATLNKAKKGPIDSGSTGVDESIQVPLTIDIFRSNGRQLGEKTVYGTFDKSLQDGEELTIVPETSTGSLSQSPKNGDDGDDNVYDVLLSYKVNTSSNNEICYLGMVDGSSGGKPLYFGGITYLSDYVMVTRGTNREIDFWIRADDSHLGV